MKKIYHIYVKDKCLLHSIDEEEFHKTWTTLNHLIGLIKSDYDKSDLSYEELYYNKESVQNSSY
ncbi:MAG: hypothetical protein EBS34_13590 [Flavobacteriales bacterium]|nr:hypothetical protein [Flavobacteriales bacterium]